ncbi:relaxase/mobilization nuclease domain-containing protein [Brachybacterium epidermidis]|uniref:relaxase/mobilization nuclease domain-containing protein n=1 Tax=Brachybacterium epidermidis TaxID=2781983 RepID=UPI00398F82C5
MLAKQLAIGATPASLVTYLYGPGRANEHTDQRMVAGSSILMAGFGPLDVAGDREAQGLLAREFDGAWRQARRELGLTLEPVEGERVQGAARADRVFHATLSLAKDEGALTDQEWARAAGHFVKRMGFVDSTEGADCAWLAVHHGQSKDGNDHIHIAVNLVREDGRRASIHQSKRRTAEAGAEIARMFGKEAVYDAELSSGIGNIPRAEWERARREKRDADRVLIRRRLAGAAMGVRNEAEFVRAARAAGVLLRPRFATGGVGAVQGYSAALAGGSKQVWFAPSKLDRSLGLPMLRERYGWSIDEQLQAVAVWRERARGADSHMRLPVVDEVRKLRADLTGPGGHMKWRRAAHDASAVLGAWSVEAEGDRRGGYLGRASDALARAAQPRRNTPREIAAEGMQTLITVGSALSPNDTASRMAVLMQAMQLVDTLRRLADAEKDVATARAQFQRALMPLQAEARVLGPQVRKEQLNNMSDDARSALLTAMGDPTAPRRDKAAAPKPPGSQPPPGRARPRTVDLDRQDGYGR